MSGALHRTLVAALLTAAGVIVPCAAWYMAGSRALHGRTASLLAAPTERGRLEAARMAQAVALRLESLREAESRRPFQDYMEDRELWYGNCVQDPLPRSSLQQGPVDPLVWAHFQVDEVGLLTLPALSGTTDPPRDSALAIEQAVLNELECASSQHLAALRRPSRTSGGEREWLSPHGVVTVGAFSWHTATIEGGPALVALREVVTPVATLTQGFVVPGGRVEALLAGSPFPAAVLPGAPAAESQALLPLQGDAWSVRVDTSQAVAAARGEAARQRSRFLGSFLLGALAAAFAGSALVALVHQSSRVAQERARFAAAAAHELRTPLAGLQLYGEMLADSVGDPTRRQLYARRVADETQRLGRVVSNILGLTQLERGGPGATPRAGDLPQAVRESIDRLRPTVEAAGATLQLDVDGELPAALFDDDALHQILQNLVDNAEKFSRGGGDRTVRVWVGVHDNRPSVSVTDRGRGVGGPLRRRIFRPFVRDPDPRAPSGLGLGLALVRALAQAQGAGVEHRDAPGGGSVFTVRFRPAV